MKEREVFLIPKYKGQGGNVHVIGPGTGAPALCGLQSSEFKPSNELDRVGFCPTCLKELRCIIDRSAS